MEALGRIASDFKTAKFSGDMQNPRELQRRAEPLDASLPPGHSNFVSAYCVCVSEPGLCRSGISAQKATLTLAVGQQPEAPVHASIRWCWSDFVAPRLYS
jgi:hypothetical protein